jgi:PKD repeat protein
MADRISSMDKGYKSGDISLFPAMRDDRDSLYEAANNAETVLRTGLPYNGKKIIVEDTSSFPDKGLVRVGPRSGGGDAELIYYGSKTKESFDELQRAFAGSRQNQWPSGSWATNSVAAEPHNATKDAIIKIEQTLGLRDNPAAGTVNRRLKDQELRFLSPKATFRAFPRQVVPGKRVRFQNFSEGDIVRYFWDFGDGTQSLEKNPVHSYSSEGLYTVKLHLITSLGAQNIATKNNYISASYDEQPSFFYAKKIGNRKYFFVDQTDGDVVQRFWVFGDGNDHVELNPNKHFVEYEYGATGNYEPSLLIVFSSENIKRIFLNESLEVE